MKLRFLCLALAVLTAGCASLAEKAGGLLDGSARTEKVIRRYRSGARGIEFQEVEYNGNRAAVILLDRVPTVKLRCSFPDSRGLFYIESLEFLAGSISGWHEFSLAVSGHGTAVFQDESVSLLAGGALEKLEITGGKIRLDARRLGGDEALGSLRNRHERIRALTEWMKDPDRVPLELQPGLQASSSRESFEKHWKPLLLPEITGRKERPEAFTSHNGPWVRAEHISWNTGYTAALLPEELAEYRNSGALLRDWEETVEWIYLEYAWERIFQVLQADGINLRLYKNSWPFE
jgi:hypothetical protein